MFSMTLACLLSVAGCENHPCKGVRGAPAPESYDAIVKSLPLDDGDEVCGHHHDPSRLVVGHTKKKPSEIESLYPRVLETAGFRRLSNRYTKANVGVFAKDDGAWEVKTSAESSGSRVIITDKFAWYRKRLGREEKRATASSRWEKRMAELAPTVRAWLPEPEVLANLKGTKPCPASINAVPDIVLTQAQLDAWGREPVRALGPCQPFGPYGQDYYLQPDAVGKPLDASACDAYLTDDSPVAILWADQAKTRAPRNQRRSRNVDEKSTFEAGVFAGRVIMWSRADERALCWAPVKATNSAVIDVEVTKNEAGKVLRQHDIGAEERDYQLQVRRAARAALSTIITAAR